MDYKNTPEGKNARKKYAELFSQNRPEPIKPRMTVSNRAKLFSPFAALRGYDDEIREAGRDHMKTERIELSDEEKGKISVALQQLRKGSKVSIRYFSDGYYEDITGIIESVDPVAADVKLYTGIKNDLGKELPVILPFVDILEIKICK